MGKLAYNKAISCGRFHVGWSRMFYPRDGWENKRSEHVDECGRKREKIGKNSPSDHPLEL